MNHVEIGARKDGTLVALKSTLICDSGAYSVYPVTASLEPLTAAGILPGPYKLPALAYDAYAVLTNKCPAGAYRGVGMALGTFVRERLVDMLARRAGLDPAEVRRRNFVGAGELPFATASGLVIDSGDPARSLERALETAGYAALRREPRRTPAGAYRGIGVAAYTEFTGMGSATFRWRGMRQVAGHDAATHVVSRDDFKPARTTASRSGLEGALNVDIRAAAFTDRDFIADLDLETGDVHFAAIDEDVTMADQLPRLRARHRVAETINDIVEATLKQGE